jgi:predicted membrane protein
MSSSVQNAIPQLDMGNTLGALFIGVILAAVLVNYLLIMQSKAERFLWPVVVIHLVSLV